MDMKRIIQTIDSASKAFKRWMSFVMEEHAIVKKKDSHYGSLFIPYQA
jgi:hypothetical protein